MRIFIAGIMQGSHADASMHRQDYRDVLRESLERAFPNANVYDPFADHRDSLSYDDSESREVFLEHNRLCAEVDLLIAYVPQASMGTAIEMWEAHQSRAFVVAITPLDQNWAIRFTSHLMVPDIDAFVEEVNSGRLKATFEEWSRK